MKNKHEVLIEIIKRISKLTIAIGSNSDKHGVLIKALKKRNRI